MRLLNAILSTQSALSDALDRCLPPHFRIDGHLNYRSDFAPRYFSQTGLEIWDIGGGKCPLIDAETKSRRNIHYVGVDISREELCSAPPGIYDEMFVGDISSFVGRGTADLIVCQAVLEHVSNTFGALRSFATILKPGGVAAIFVPARNTVPACLNLLVPENTKRKLLSMFWPHLDGKQGFKAYYDRCTAPAFRRMADQLGFELIEERLFHQSGYFRYMFPVHLLWRVWCCAAFAVHPAFWAESFSMALRKPA